MSLVDQPARSTVLRHSGARRLLAPQRELRVLQVRRGGGTAGCTRCLPSGPGARLLGSPVRGQRARSRQPCAPRTFGKRSLRFDGIARPSVFRVCVLKHRQCLLGALYGVASDHAKILLARFDDVGHVLTVAGSQFDDVVDPLIQRMHSRMLYCMQSTSVRIDTATHEQLKRLASDLGTTVGETVALAVRRLRQEQIGKELRASLTPHETRWLDADLG